MTIRFASGQAPSAAALFSRATWIATSSRPLSSRTAHGVPPTPPGFAPELDTSGRLAVPKGTSTNTQFLGELFSQGLGYQVKIAGPYAWYVLR